MDPFKTSYTKQVMKDHVEEKVSKINHWRQQERDTNTEIHFQRGHNKVTKWSEQEKNQRCVGEDRLFDKIIKNASIYESNMERVENERSKLQQSIMSKASPLKGGVSNNMESSRIMGKSNNQVNINEQDQSQMLGGGGN